MPEGNRSRFSLRNRQAPTTPTRKVTSEDVTSALGYTPASSLGGGGTSATNTVQIMAGQALGGNRAVYTGSDGKAYLANPDVSSKVLFGVTTGAANINTMATIQIGGVAIEPTWNWDPTLPVWLASNGVLTQTVPTGGYLVQVGTPVSSTAMRIEPRLIAIFAG